MVAGPLFKGLDLANLTPVMFKRFRAGAWASHPWAQSECLPGPVGLIVWWSNDYSLSHITEKLFFFYIFFTINCKIKSGKAHLNCVCMCAKHPSHSHEIRVVLSFARNVLRKFDSYNYFWLTDCHWIFSFILDICIFKYSLLIPVNECIPYVTLTRLKRHHRHKWGNIPLQRRLQTTHCVQWPFIKQGIPKRIFNIHL